MSLAKSILSHAPGFVRPPEYSPKVSIVTGGASGIGKALAQHLAARGGQVTIADIDLRAAQATADELNADQAIAGAGGKVTPAPLDVRDFEAFTSLVNQVDGEHGGIDLLCNNAGVLVSGPFGEMGDSHWRNTLEINIGGVVNGCRAIWPVYQRQRRGDILNTASTAGLMPAPMMTPYTTSKWAVIGLSTALRTEAAQFGVNVSAVAPGFVDTPLLDDVQEPTASYRQGDFRANAIRVGGKLITADQVAVTALNGLARKQAVIPVGLMAHALWRANRYLPIGMDLGTRREVRTQLQNIKNR